MSKIKEFSPLSFLASLGAGGIAVIPFAFFQYTLSHGKGLINISQIWHGNLPFLKEILFYSLEGVMIVFTLIHFVLTYIYFRKLIPWLKGEAYKLFINDPLKNAAVLTPFISIAMTFNVFLASIRFFVPQLYSNLQELMLPGMIGWVILWALLMRMEIKLLKISFTQNFDVSKISFGWLLHPFALGMVTVTGTGIAAMAKNPDIATPAAFMSLISGTMGMFLLVVKLITIFKSHFEAKGLPEKQFLPSFLIVVPNITLYAISVFRLSHYFEVHFGFHLHALAVVAVVVSFTFQTWYLMFGLTMLKDYFKNHFFKKEFYVTLWALVCPFVAYAVLGSFVYKLFMPGIFMMTLVLLTTVFVVSLYFIILKRQAACAGVMKNESFDCAS